MGSRQHGRIAVVERAHEYVRRATPVHALQYTGHNLVDLKVFAGMAVWERHNAKSFGDALSTVWVTTPFGPAIIRPTEWLMRDVGLRTQMVEWTVIKDEDFTKLFVLRHGFDDHYEGT